MAERSWMIVACGKNRCAASDQKGSVSSGGTAMNAASESPRTRSDVKTDRGSSIAFPAIQPPSDTGTPFLSKEKASAARSSVTRPPSCFLTLMGLMKRMGSVFRRRSLAPEIRAALQLSDRGLNKLPRYPGAVAGREWNRGFRYPSCRSARADTPLFRYRGKRPIE